MLLSMLQLSVLLLPLILTLKTKGIIILLLFPASDAIHYIVLVLSMKQCCFFWLTAEKRALSSITALKLLILY